jgi:hypothetical protein
MIPGFFRSNNNWRFWKDIRYLGLSLKIAKYSLHQIIGLRAESMPPGDVIGSFLLVPLFSSLSVVLL